MFSGASKASLFLFLCPKNQPGDSVPCVNLGSLAFPFSLSSPPWGQDLGFISEDVTVLMGLGDSRPISSRRDLSFLRVSRSGSPSEWAEDTWRYHSALCDNVFSTVDAGRCCVPFRLHRSPLPQPPPQIQLLRNTVFSSLVVSRWCLCYAPYVGERFPSDDNLSITEAK